MAAQSRARKLHRLQARPHNAGSVLVLEAVFEHVQVAVFEHVQVELGASCAMP